MAVFRVEKTRDYTVMANHHLKNKALSLKAKGLLSIMLSLPETWNYTTRGLAAICREGVDSISSALRELEKAGYVVRYRLRDERGRITDTEYVIYRNAARRNSAGLRLHQIRKTRIWIRRVWKARMWRHRNRPRRMRHHQIRKTRIWTNRMRTDRIRATPYNISRIQKTQINQNISRKSVSIQSASIQRRVCVGRARTGARKHRLRLPGDGGKTASSWMASLICSPKNSAPGAAFIRISGVDYPAQMVKERFGQINSLHIQYVFECLENTASRIRNIRQYLLATPVQRPGGRRAATTTLAWRYDRSLGWLCPPAKAAQV